MLQYSYQLTYLYPLLVVHYVHCHPLAVLGKCQEKHLFHPLCESKCYLEKKQQQTKNPQSITRI